jgi:hypothetical protein
VEQSDSLITAELVRRFAQDGFFILENALPARDLQALRGECQRFIEARDREMARQGVDALGLDHRGRRYFLPAYTASPPVRRFLLGDLMAALAGTLLGDTVYLFNEQYVVKAAEQGMRFGWHQDSGFIDYPHGPLPELLDRPGRGDRGQRDRLPAALPACRYPRRRTPPVGRADPRPHRLHRRRPGRPGHRQRGKHRLLFQYRAPSQRRQHHGSDPPRVPRPVLRRTHPRRRAHLTAAPGGPPSSKRTPSRPPPTP